ncbi:hypothetical protein ERJ75_001275600 [Trypanosoma vivax]|nr:hypothetical protein ERJ75_001275600 [Trypanosoma vivax]
MGGCGLRRQMTIAEFAHECVGHKNLQRSQNRGSGQRPIQRPIRHRLRAERQVLTANAAAGAGRALTDPQVCTDDAAFAPTCWSGCWSACCPTAKSASAARTPPTGTCTRAPSCTASRASCATTWRTASLRWGCAVRLRLHDGAAPQRGEQAAARPAHHGPRHTGRHRRDVTHPAVHPRGGKRSDSHTAS